MRVALLNLEPKIENTAMMQVSMYHKQRGEIVEPYSSLYHAEYDRIYAFSLFSYTDKKRVTPDMITGGTGFNVRSRLPPEIEACDLDYSVFPRCRTSYLWFSRGCIRRCPFCVIPVSEGNIRAVQPKNLNPRGEYVSVMDNNFFANPEWRKAVEYLVKLGQPVNFHQGIDIRIFSDEQGRALQRLNFWKQLYVAWDDPQEKHVVLNGIQSLMKYVPKSRIGCYVLIGYKQNGTPWSTPEEDLDRVHSLLNLGVDAYVMPFNKKDPYQMAFLNWVNSRLASKIKWEDYEHGSWKALSKQVEVSNI